MPERLGSISSISTHHPPLIDTASTLDLGTSGTEIADSFSIVDHELDFTALLKTVGGDQDNWHHLNASTIDGQVLSGGPSDALAQKIGIDGTSMVPLQSNEGYQGTYFIQQPPLSDICPYYPSYSSIATLGTRDVVDLVPGSTSLDDAVEAIKVPGHNFPTRSSQQLVIFIARTYPRMMTQPNNLPPFVHSLHCEQSYWLESLLSRSLPSPKVGSASAFAVPASDNPLAVCVQLSHMFISQGSNSMDLWRRTMWAEQKRIEHNVSWREFPFHPHAKRLWCFALMLLLKRKKTSDLPGR